MTVLLLGKNLEILKALAHHIPNVKIIGPCSKTMKTDKLEGISIVILDMNNPVSDWKACLKHITTSIPDVPILALFDSNSTYLREEIKACGIRQIISHKDDIRAILFPLLNDYRFVKDT